MEESYVRQILVKLELCPHCGAVHDRDRNAAINILKVGASTFFGGKRNLVVREKNGCGSHGKREKPQKLAQRKRAETLERARVVVS